MTRIAGHGLVAEVPTGWDARIYKRTPEPGATTHPVLHAANFPLPADRGDFGSGAVENMGPDDVLVVLVDFGPAAATTAAFSASKGIPEIAVSDFDPATLQRTIAGQSGTQKFFNDGGRAFCLYVVLGSHARRVALVPEARRLIAGLRTQK